MKLHSVLSFSIFLQVGVLLSEVRCSSNDCGQSKSDNNGSFPWNVGIYVENQNHLELICFGSVIQSNAVLTAAHCFYDNIKGSLRNATFYIASDNLAKKFDLKSKPSTLHKVNKNTINIQKHYKGLVNLFTYDVAIIKDKFHFNQIKPVCMDWSGDVKDNNLVGKQPIWSNNKVVIVEQSYLNPDDCSYEAPQDFVSFIAEDKSCTKIKTSGVRLGHESEGAGVVFSSNNRWYLKGVISVHEPNQGKVSTYTLTAQYMNWISNVCATV
jgi:hypothetical protein